MSHRVEVSKYKKNWENINTQMSHYKLYTVHEKNYCSDCDSYFYVSNNNMVCKLKQTGFTDQDEQLDDNMAKGIHNIEDNNFVANRRIVRAISVDSSAVQRKKVVRTLSVGRGKLKVMTRTVSIQTDRTVVDSSTSMDLVPAEEERFRCPVGSNRSCHCHGQSDDDSTILRQRNDNNNQQMAVRISGMLLRAMGDSFNARVDLDNPQQPIVIFNIPT